jgi:uncharacterized protein (DUF927 family)
MSDDIESVVQRAERYHQEISDAQPTAPEPTNGGDRQEPARAVDHEAKVFNTIPEPDQPVYTNVDHYTMSGAGLFVTVERGSGQNKQTHEIKVAGPFEILGRSRNPKGGDWGHYIHWRDHDGRQHTHCVAAATLQSESSLVCAELARGGLVILNKHHLVEYLNRVTVDGRVTVVPRTGWCRPNCFVLPDQVIGESFKEKVILADGVDDGSPFVARGTLEQWQKNVAAPLADHAIPAFAVSVGFAGPLLETLGIEGGAFQFVGISSIGKSMMCNVCASEWGRGQLDGFVHPWRSTANALEATAALHSDTVLVLDELGTADPKEAAAAIYALAGGKGKSRARRDGHLKPSATWKILVLSNGEVRLADKLGEIRQKSRAGQEVRLIDIPADAGRGYGVFDSPGPDGAHKLADTIKRNCSIHYGRAGPEFVRRLIAAGKLDNTDDLEKAMATFTKDNVPAGADPQVHRGANRFALVAVAGELAIDLGILPWAKGTAAGAAKRCFEAWIEARGGIEAHEVRQAIEQVATYITMHGASRFDTHSRRSRSSRT